MLSLFMVLAVRALAQKPVPIADWPDSPEAYFLTAPERAEWSTLTTDGQREQFRERYWTRRDPTPSTPRNEFREIVEGRIAVADRRFPIEGTRGSYTARGKVFVILGSPAYVKSTHNVPVQPREGVAYNLTEGNETFVTWTYDPLRTPQLLKALNRASLEFTFRIEPSLRRDILENPGLFNQLRDQLAAMSLVPPPGGASLAELVVETIPGPALPKDVEQQLDSVEAPASLSTTTIWRDSESPVTLLWLHAVEPQTTSPLFLYGRVRDADQKTVVTVAREVRPALGFTTHMKEIVVGSQLPLSSGTYDATFILADSTGKTLAAATGRTIVPVRRPELHLSSLVLTDTLATPETTSAISLGGILLRPRADATFTNAETMCFALQVVQPKDPSSVKLRVVLRRRDGSSTQTSEVAAALRPTGPDSFFVGYEFPLQTLSPGDYSLYVTVTDGTEEEVRRADFHVVHGPS